MSGALTVRLRDGLPARTDFSAVLGTPWTTAAAAEVARRTVRLETDGPVSLGELCEVRGKAAGRVRFEGDFALADRLAAGLQEGEVVIEGNVGREVGLGMAGGSVEVRGNAGSRAAGAAPELKRGMSGGELVVRGSAGPEVGAGMRRGLVAIGGSVAGHAGMSTIAGTVVILGDAGPSPGLWSKRGSILALGPVSIPPTYRYACTYQPTHVRVILTRLRARYGLPIEERHIEGLYRRYSGDLAELGRGEILAWSGP